METEILCDLIAANALDFKELEKRLKLSNFDEEAGAE